jgi:hypothetical protein
VVQEAVQEDGLDEIVPEYANAEEAELAQEALAA